MYQEHPPMKCMLVTGGCGFIGANFIHHVLSELTHCRVVNLDKLTYAGNPENLSTVSDHPRYRFVKGDICDFLQIEKLLNEEAFDTVVHFAAESHVDRSIYGPNEFVHTNVLGTQTLLEAIRQSWQKRPADQKKDFRFLQVSTDEVYGTLGDTGSFSEETAYDPRSPYSASKAGADHLVNAYFHTYALPTLITNCSNNYGPYQFPEKLIPLIIINASNGKELPVYGDGSNVRDWLHVQDHCQAILAVINRGVPGQTYNVGANCEKRNIEIVELLCDILDRKLPPLDNKKTRRSLIKFISDRPGHDRRYAINAEKIRTQLGWQPQVSFSKGLEQTVDWYLGNQEWIQAILDGSYQEYYKKMYEQREE